MQITRFRGDTSSDEFSIYNNTTGAPANLTGSSLVLTINSVLNPTDASQQLFQMTGNVSDPTTGVVDFTPTLLQANNLGTYYFDIQLTDNAGVIRTLVKDVYEFVQDITK